MKALIFAAGIGSRLKPFTDTHPKALATVGGITMLQRNLERVRDAGADRIVVNVHHFPEQIIAFLDSIRYPGVEIIVSDESDRLLDTGGGLLKARDLIGASPAEPVILHNADILTDAPLSAMVEQHISKNAVATLLVSRRQSSRMLYFNDKQRLAGWANLKTGETKPEGFDNNDLGITPLAFGGVHIVDPAIFPALARYADTHGAMFSITPFYLASLSEIGIFGFTPQENFIWHDIGSPQKLAEAEAAITGSRQDTAMA